MKVKIAGPRPETLIRWSTVIAVSLVAIIAAWISYDHTVSVVSVHGEHGSIGRVYAGTIDGLIYAGSMVLLDCARRRIDAPKLAYAMLGSGIAATLYINVVSGLAYGVLGSAVAAWPALALVGSFELLMYLVRSGTASTVATDGAEIEPAALPAPVSGTETIVPQLAAEIVPAVMPYPRPAPVLDTVPPPVPTPRTRRARSTVASRSRSRSPKSVEERAEDAYRDIVLSGSPLPSIRDLKALGMGTASAQRAHSHLAQLAGTASSNGNGSNGHV